MPTILLKKSDTPGSVPGTANLTNLAGGAEVAVNTADKRMFSMTSASAVIELGTNPSSLTCADASLTVARIGSLTVSSLSLTNVTVTSATVTTLTGTSANITTVTGTTAGFSSANITQFQATSATITTLTGTSANVTNASAGSLTVFTGNLTFSGTGQRITGDMSNATVTSRVALQTSTANSNTILTVLPTGTGSGTFTEYYQSGTDPANSSVLSVGLAGGAGVTRINSTITGTGTYLPLTFYTGGSERMRLDTSGNLGIGTASPVSKLSVGGNPPSSGVLAGVSAADSISLALSDNTNNSLYVKHVAGGAATFGTDSGGQLAFATNGFTERMRIDSSGNVGIGGTAGAFAKIQALGTLPNSSNQTYTFLTTGTIPSSNTGTAVGFYSNQSTAAASFTLSNTYHFYANPTAKGAGSTITNQYGFVAESTLTDATNNYGFYSNIASGSNRWNFYANGTAANYFAGDVGIGRTPAASTRLTIKGQNNGTGNFSVYVENSTPTEMFKIRDDGTFYTGLAGNSPYNLTTGSAANVFVDSDGILRRSTSSLRYKSDVADADHGLSDVLKLRSVTYRGKNDGDKTFGGLIAEEVHDAGLTEFVAYDKEGRPDALHYGNMVALLVKAVQELKAELDALKAV